MKHICIKLQIVKVHSYWMMIRLTTVMAVSLRTEKLFWNNFLDWQPYLVPLVLKYVKTSDYIAFMSGHVANLVLCHVVCNFHCVKVTDIILINVSQLQTQYTPELLRSAVYQILRQ